MDRVIQALMIMGGAAAIAYFVFEAKIAVSVQMALSF